MGVRVLNRHHLPGKRIDPATMRYVGRGTPFGNPFRVGDGVCDTREEAVRNYAMVFHASSRLKALAREQLTGYDLVCSCAPKPCHADVIAEYLS